MLERQRPECPRTVARDRPSAAAVLWPPTAEAATFAPRPHWEALPITLLPPAIPTLALSVVRKPQVVQEESSLWKALEKYLDCYIEGIGPIMQAVHACKPEALLMMIRLLFF